MLCCLSIATGFLDVLIKYNVLLCYMLRLLGGPYTTIANPKRLPKQHSKVLAWFVLVKTGCANLRLSDAEGGGKSGAPVWGEVYQAAGRVEEDVLRFLNVGMAIINLPLWDGKTQPIYGGFWGCFTIAIPSLQ